jgi:hypothetical protein
MAGTFTPSDMELSPALLFWQPNGSTATYYLGGTLKNVKLNFEYDKSPIKADQYGTSVLDNRISGVKVMLTTEVAQVKDFQLFNFLFPDSTLVGNPPYDGTSTTASVKWTNTVGNADLNIAGTLTLHPQAVGATSVTNYNWTFTKACPTEKSEITYGPTEQAAWKIEWTILPDTTQNPPVWFTYG